ncbi:hypothetical protein KBA63_03985 [Candidatus Woesebacteria bacterium]|nr:hypothetical protein [Candidatus Woesebacteria bacterium]
MMSHKDIVSGINWKFNHYVDEYKRPYSDKEAIYIRAFRHYLVLSEYGIFPEKASVSLNALAKLHLGYNLDEIHEFTLTVGRNNVHSLVGVK